MLLTEILFKLKENSKKSNLIKTRKEFLCIEVYDIGLTRERKHLHKNVYNNSLFADRNNQET
jgi:hypothetical protein